MDFRVQFLDASANIIAEWAANASDVAGAIDLVDGLTWPTGALRIQIIDEDGRLVHWGANRGDEQESRSSANTIAPPAVLPMSVAPSGAL
jgi:hypothetical protein